MKSPRYLGVLFDLDGTLLDSKADLVAAVRHAFQTIGIPAPAPEVVVQHIGKPLIQFPTLVGVQLTGKQVLDFVHEYRAWYQIHCLDHTTTFPGTFETLSALKRLGVRMGVVTVKRQDQAEDIVVRAGLREYFEIVRGWTESERMKPDPEPLLRTAKVLGTPPAVTLMVGDSEADIIAAQRAGMDVCACMYGYRSPEYLLSLRPTWSIQQLTDLLPIVTHHGATESVPV